MILKLMFLTGIILGGIIIFTLFFGWRCEIGPALYEKDCVDRYEGYLYIKEGDNIAPECRAPEDDFCNRVTNLIDNWMDKNETYTEELKWEINGR